MNRSTQIRQVFAELRYSLGDRVSACDALEAAASLVDLFTIEEESEPQFSLRTGGVPFSQWALDVAMSDGGWRVLRNEIAQSRDIDEQEEWEMGVYREFKQYSEGARA